MLRQSYGIEYEHTARLARRLASQAGKPMDDQRMKKIILATTVLALLAAPALRADDGKTIYEKECTKCHGADGKGDTKMGKKLGAKDYSDAKVQAALTDEAAFKAIKEGFKSKDDKVLMKPTEGVSDADIKAVVAYLRTLKK